MSDVKKNPIRILVLCLSLSACRDSAVIWSQSAESPSGKWVATAETEQFGGLGTAAVETSVYLRQTTGQQKQLQIVGLSNVSAYPSGITNLDLVWLAPSQLRIIYSGEATVDFQVIKCLGVEISLQHKT